MSERLSVNVCVRSIRQGQHACAHLLTACCRGCVVSTMAAAAAAAAGSKPLPLSPRVVAAAPRGVEGASPYCTSTLQRSEQ